MSSQILDIAAPVLNHKYYGAIMFKSSDKFSQVDARFEWICNPVNGVETILIFAHKSMPTTSWKKLSSIQSVTDSQNLPNSCYIRNFEVKATDYSYCDDLIIIDLTEAFGAGNEPNQEWCDNHITFFDGTTTIYK